MWVRHGLLCLVVTGGILAFSGFTITMFGYAASCESTLKCQVFDYSALLFYKVSGPIFFILGLAIATTGVVLKWMRKPKHLRLDYRASSIEGTNFTGETNIEGGEENFEPLPGENENFSGGNEEIGVLHPNYNDGIDRGTPQLSNLSPSRVGIQNISPEETEDPPPSYNSLQCLDKSGSTAIEGGQYSTTEENEDGEGLDETDRFMENNLEVCNRREEEC